MSLRVYTDTMSEAVEARNIFAGMARTSFDYKTFMEDLKYIDGRLYGLASRYPGLRPGRCMSLYAALIDSVVKQRVALPIALRVYSRLVERYGVQVEV